MKKYCCDCDIKEYCEYNPGQCPIAQKNKLSADVEKAKAEIMKPIRNKFDFIIDRIETFLRGVINGI